MGEAGQQRARATYDWKVIIPQYEALFTQLSEIRRGQSVEQKPLAHPWPARMDPFHAFSAYPTFRLTAETVISLRGDNRETVLRRTLRIRDLAMVRFAEFVLPQTMRLRR